MKGARKKFVTDFAASISSARWVMVSASQLASGNEMSNEQRELLERCHIYLICKHPGFAFDPEHFRYENGVASGILRYKVAGMGIDLPFDIEFPLLDGAQEIALSPYPHREIITRDHDGEIVRYLPAGVIALQPNFALGTPRLREFEVLYVGQAYGDGDRSAFERLQTHGTLQKILAEAQYSSPDDEVFLMMFEYPYYRVISMIDGKTSNVSSAETDCARFSSILQNQLTERQQICLTEAALIRYFAPKYNAVYKESFPSDSHKILAQCYELDFTALVVEIDVEELNYRLWSERAKPSWHHIAQIELSSEEDRRGFFHLSRGDGTFFTVPGLIR